MKDVAVEACAFYTRKTCEQLHSNKPSVSTIDTLFGQGGALTVAMETPTFQELKHGVFQTFKAPALFLPSSISYTSTADKGYQQVTAKREDYAAHPSLNLAVTKEQVKEPDLSLTLPFTDNMVAPSICIFQADWM